MVWWFVSGHHLGGKRACCEKHCTPAVRWRRARRRLVPFSIAIGVIVALVVGLGPAVVGGCPWASGWRSSPDLRRSARVARVVAGPARQPWRNGPELPESPASRPPHGP